MHEEESTVVIPPSPLEYARPRQERASRPPRPLAAVFACLPGLICWMVFFSLFVRRFPFARRWFPVRNFDSPYGAVFILCCWGIAVITAVGSLFRYGPRSPKPWYVWLNLLINVTGLLFTAGIAFLILVAVVH